MIYALNACRLTLPGGVINIKQHDWREVSAIIRVTEERGMSELRKDPIIDRWVIVSPERSQRPSDIHVQPGIQPSDVCPYCPGHEA